MKYIRRKILLTLIVFFAAFFYYYIKLPALNIHSRGFWGFAILIFVIALVASLITSMDYSGIPRMQFPIVHLYGKRRTIVWALGIATVALILTFTVGSILSSPVFNAEKYRNLIQIKNGDFQKDIQQISYSEIPILDKDSAKIIGNRKMGSMVEYISQFEVCDNYSQINYKNKPVRVTPLRYGNILKWFTNQKQGIPAYIQIDMATQDAKCVKLSQGMKYTEADHFNRNIYRYLRFRYPTYIFGDLNFEIDENGTPVYVCPVKDYTIGLFGGETVSKVVIVNTITGENTCYDVDKVPSWVDRVYSAGLLLSYYNYYGSLKHGYWNSVLSQKDCLKTTDGYNYIALANDVWVYTGITSVGKDQSNVGFILMNQRTGETRYYSVPGATENSAMRSAEGKIQQMKYTATFPLFLNILNKPTYFICLKDSGGLVKQYAMVNIEKYTIVAIGSTIPECEKDYEKQLKQNSLLSDSESQAANATNMGKIAQISQAVIDGNSHFYLILQGSDKIYDVNVANCLDVIRYKVGDTIKLEYTEGDSSNTVLKILP